MIAAVALAGFLTGFGKSGVAGTLGPFVTVLVALTIPADEAIGLLLPMLIVADAFTIAAHWDRWDVDLLRPLLFSALLGIGVGSLVISSVSEPALRTLIALATLGFAAVYMWSRTLRIRPEHMRRFAVPAGATAGLTSTLAHLGGPPIVVYLMSAGVDPRTFVGTSAAFFAAVNLLKVPGYLYAGLLDADLIVSTMWAWALIPVGVVLGRLMVDRINRTWFERITLLLLAGGAVILLLT